MQDILKNLTLTNGFDLFEILKAHFYVGDENSWWWPSLRSLEVKNGVELKGAQDSQAPSLEHCIASFLGQNTKYENAHSAQLALYEYFYKIIAHDISTPDMAQFSQCQYPHLAYISQEIFADKILEILAHTPLDVLAQYTHKAGFHNQKAQRITLFARNLIADFGDFATFSAQVEKEWLLAQKGIGQESASSILNYALKREEMVVDSYTQRLLGLLGFEFYDYEGLQSFVASGMERGKESYDFDISLAQVFARFHGKIVEFSKANKLRARVL